MQLEMAVCSAGSGHLASGETPQDCSRALLPAGDCAGMPVHTPQLGCEVFSV